ncbi:sensor histidine kinase [Ancylobacter vacuolatus]|uniref:histidine kinase n=1 Tax=Ancylobacter vacuolatus TaxID=223389 RepID=A0ABU0DMQ2_9HYPH|nr:HAMP domain-containing sensor histidine kinase [Ancylobacter vacuolatus]MDQ0349670.1 signal transduction histidine kinase [Ancylobacter vacuolatus]
MTAVLLCAWIVMGVLYGDDGGYAQFDAAIAIRTAIQPDGNGSFKLERTPELESYKAQFPTLWFLLTDGHTTISYGAVPGWVSAGATVWDTPQAMSGYVVHGSDMTLERLVAGDSDTDPTIRIEVGGVAYTSSQLTRAILADLDMTTIPLLIVLLATILLTVLVVPVMIARPVRRAARAAELIDGSREGVRLPETGPPAELRPLVSAFNRALDRIDMATAEQRRFLSHAAHELRTPLARVRTRLERVEDGQLRAELVADVQDLSATVTMLLQLARLAAEPTALGRLDLVGVGLRALAQDAPMAIAAGLEVEFRNEKGPIPIVGSAQAIGIALSNLIRNAVQHGAKGGRIIVEVQRPGRIAVIDEGEGIACAVGGAEALTSIARAKNSGTGLGLTIVAQVAALHKAKVSIEETPGGGTTVALIFPPAREGMEG